MGFLDGLVKGLGGNAAAKEILNMYKEDDEDALLAQADGKRTDYRKKAFENTSSYGGKYKCVRCGRLFDKDDIDIDHIIPQSCGGDSTRYNLQCMCKHCNRSKQADTSDTASDLLRRKKELDQQDKDDIKYIKNIRKKGEE